MPAAALQRSNRGKQDRLTRRICRPDIRIQSLHQGVIIMADGIKKTSYVVRPPTAVLTRGFDPRLSVGSARPAVFRSSTYVFSSPESAERAFAIALGQTHPTEDESVDLIYARLSHPNAEI